jgi:hypothetical protein
MKTIFNDNNPKNINKYIWTILSTLNQNFMLNRLRPS